MCKKTACGTGSVFGHFAGCGLMHYETNMVVLHPPFDAVVLRMKKLIEIRKES
jgi:hypothetical protein